MLSDGLQNQRKQKTSGGRRHLLALADLTSFSNFQVVTILHFYIT